MAYDPTPELGCYDIPVDKISSTRDDFAIDSHGRSPLTLDELNPQSSHIRYINAIADSQKVHRWMVTMVNRQTGAEELLDIVCAGGSFKDMAQEVRRHFNYDWEIFEWFDPEVPF